MHVTPALAHRGGPRCAAHTLESAAAATSQLAQVDSHLRDFCSPLLAPRRSDTHRRMVAPRWRAGTAAARP